ncbi:3D domain-containing protein [Photobacterium sp. CCB-ST2H9]|nr:3D domain-containing protein [Photobacterium sp. CCB-ST2H9]UTM57452.1 3D domain-containing protein [Photobacterium sp. CCB-ST2H9]
MKRKFGAFLLLIMSLGWCFHASAMPSGSKISVTATAYNSLSSQTDGNPSIAAWGDRLKPGMKAIAVSRDLLRMGLKHGSKVKISGLPGEYVVLDKMHRRWSKKIDIYMGRDVRAAKNWGRRKVTITVVEA